MIVTILRYCFLGIAAAPFIYYLLCLYSSWRFFRSRSLPLKPEFLPAISNLKPIKGADPDAYENFASLFRQNYPQFELLFCVSDEHDLAVGILKQLARDFPDVDMRIIFGSGRVGPNDKVAKLARLCDEASYEVLVINDSDVRVAPDYFRTIVAPLQEKEVGAVTCLYTPIENRTVVDALQSAGMVSDFFPSIFVARELDGVKFALGTTIATTKTCLEEFGGYDRIVNQPADDLLIGRLVADHGHRVELLPYKVTTVSDYDSLRALLYKRLRWIVVMRHMRPAGHFGLLFTFGLPWTILAMLVAPKAIWGLILLAAYILMRLLITWAVGVRGMHEHRTYRLLPLVFVWDLVAFLLWIVSFTRSTIRWRNRDYAIRGGELVPVTPK